MPENQVGEKIRQLRESKSFSIKELAEKSQISIDLLEKLEDNAVIPSLSPLLKIAKALDVRLGTFLDDSPQIGPVIVKTGKSENVIRFSGKNSNLNKSTLDFYSLASGKTDRHMEPFLIDVHPPETKDYQLSSHEGEEFIFVMDGEICCKGYNIMKGYYKMPEKTREVIDKEGWLHSGDLAICDNQGYYSIVGRIKDMIIRGGENIYPREIEEFIHTIDGIIDVQVVGIPDEKYGEIIGAFIIKEEDSQLTEEDIQDYAITKIARYKVPKHIFFVEKFPRTASGKIQKFKLKDQAVELIKIENEIQNKYLDIKKKF